MEIWKDIAGSPGYQVSTLGRIRSFINNRHGISDKHPHILAQTKNQNGYFIVSLGRNRKELVHRLVAGAFLPNNDFPIVRHLDDNPANNAVTNLAWGTQTDNMQDCVRHGRLAGDTSFAIKAKSIPVLATDLSTGNALMYPSIQEAARELNLWPQHVCSALHGKIRQTGGYSFDYAKEADNAN